MAGDTNQKFGSERQFRAHSYRANVQCRVAREQRQLPDTFAEDGPIGEDVGDYPRNEVDVGELPANGVGRSARTG